MSVFTPVCLSTKVQDILLSSQGTVFFLSHLHWKFAYESVGTLRKYFGVILKTGSVKNIILLTQSYTAADKTRPRPNPADKVVG